MSEDMNHFPYVHGFSSAEQARLREQAAFSEHIVYQDVDFSDVSHLLEVGCGVAAQTEILLRRFPNCQVTGIDLNERQLAAAQQHLQNLSYADKRYHIQQMDAAEMDFESAHFDGAFLCWILEHVPDPAKVLSEVKRVLKNGATVIVTEVMNSSFFLDPYSPHIWKYWMAFNDFQFESAGDPFIGAKLGNLLLDQDFLDIETKVKTWHLDNRTPKKRRECLLYWMNLLLSAADALLESRHVTEELIKQCQLEFEAVVDDPNAVFYYSFIQATAKVGCVVR